MLFHMAESAQQNQTLSLRISEALRKRLEAVRKLAAVRKGESVSTSEIAKQLLESAREDRLEVVELLSQPTEALLEIRSKGETGHTISRAQWTALVYYVQQGSEAFSRNPLSRESYIGILKAFESAYQLRAKPSGPDTAQNDEYYLGNLPSECRPTGAKRPDKVTPETVRLTVAETARQLNNPATKLTPSLAARNLYVLLDEEKLGGATALNDALSAHWPVLWRVGARGHYFVTGAPIRDRRPHDPMYTPTFPPVREGGFGLSFAPGKENDFSMLLSFPGDRGPMYPLGRYPMISEFRAMLAAFTPQSREHQRWNGEHFLGYVTEREKDREFWFRAHDNGITFGFSTEEWETVRELFRRAWEMPELRFAWDALNREYGEL